MNKSKEKREKDFQYGEKEETKKSYFSNFSDDIWWSDEKALGGSEDKLDILKKDTKITKFFPEKMKSPKKAPDNFGYFESKFGTFSVGYKKYKNNSDIVFSLIPEKVKNKKGLPSRNKDSKNTYFNAEKGRRKHFESSVLSFEYIPSQSKIVKLENDSDGIVDSEKNLLFEDEQELKKAQYLEKLDKKNNPKLKNEIKDLREIQHEEEKDNAEILKEIRQFVEKFKKARINKFIDSDEAVSREKRIFGAINDDIILLRTHLRKLLEKFYKKSGVYLDLNINKLSKDELKKAIDEIKHKMD